MGSWGFEVTRKTVEKKIKAFTKYGLALHTTTPELGLAISNFGGETRSDVWNLERQVSSLLHQYLIEFIQPQTWTDLGFIAVAKGPGGFTGTRIGVVAARTLGQQLDIPVFAISTLAAVAYSELENRGQEIGHRAIAVQMPAQRGQVFGAIYQLTPDSFELNILLPDTVFTPETWQEKLASWHTEYELIEAKSGLAATVNNMLSLAYLDWCLGKRPDWSEASPYYGQHPV
ncbi:MAG: tRNA (adenosine(37)-N6)-threonylcarbamoyltransferase complex dimerization subunit type 1 TsaB [Calothrix sp. MO_167.B12]|nr:tRNA (adenosine(37)-N6)-threonylcarbamoyltransferase complex dimerization subunit type 1 TsaB [Calothrix sp. MO_167.B12]